ncbi:nucleoid-associated protein YgaU [Arthrobacter sp. PL16]|uniref:LysM peptidoglycan-binding domain-containing protein n=1 Tax=Arthrobacter sp. PL16 TaxID=3071720 RepID=UPI002E04F044|nr:nucleoid-associated protein YgaU [Arthrobacter sp. PL16]
MEAKLKTADVLLAGVILGCATVMARAGQALHRGTGAGSLEGVLGLGMSALGLTLVGWWVLTLFIAVVAEVVLRRGPSTAARRAQRCTPALMRRLAAAFLGLNLIVVPSVAQAASGGPDAVCVAVVSDGATAICTTEQSYSSVSAHTEAASFSKAPYWSPLAVSAAMPTGDSPGASKDNGVTERDDPREEQVSPVSPTWQPAPMPAHGGALLRSPTRTIIADGEVVVAPGDSLWSIAGDRLGPLATATDIAGAWPAWYDTNMATIGDDPSLLLPGQVLKVPQT